MLKTALPRGLIHHRQFCQLEEEERHLRLLQLHQPQLIHSSSRELPGNFHLCQLPLAQRRRGHRQERLRQLVQLSRVEQPRRYIL